MSRPAQPSRSARPARRLLAVTLAALALGAAACGDGARGPLDPGDGGEQVPPPASTLEVTGAGTVMADYDLTLGAAVRTNGQARPATGVVWTSEDPAVATVSAQGIVRGKAAGTAWIVATSEGRTARARVTVVPRTVTTIRLDAEQLSLAVGQGRILQPQLLDANGRLVWPRTPVWTTSDPAVAYVSADGQISARGTGEAWVTATADGATARVRVVVYQRALGGRYLMRVHDLATTNVRCTVEAVHVTLTRVGPNVTGSVTGAVGGPRVSCEPIPGTQGPWVTPAAPLGELQHGLFGEGRLQFEVAGTRWFFLNATQWPNGVVAGVARVFVPTGPVECTEWGSCAQRGEHFQGGFTLTPLD